MEQLIKIQVDGKDYNTIIDENGIQRFIKNAIICHLIETENIDLNLLSIDYQKGKFTDIEYMEFYMGMGYSVCGFSEIFHNASIENPLWK